MSHSSTVGVSADFTSAPIPPENLARLRAILFGPAPYADTDDAPDEVDHSSHPTCGLDAAMDRFERHLRWFEEDARALGGGR